MRKRKHKGTEFTILDAILLATLPEKHRIASIASRLITSGAGFPMPVKEAHEYASYLSETKEEEGKLVDSLLVEVQRQIRIKIKRMDDQRKLKNDRAMGSQLDRDTRINRVCGRIFGSPSNWLPEVRAPLKVVSPRYAWLHRSPDQVVVAGIDWWSTRFGDLTAGFVYREHGGPVRCISISSHTRSVEELCVVLGLHPRLLDSPSTRVDWKRRAFIVGETNRLPWVYS